MSRNKKIFWITQLSMIAIAVILAGTSKAFFFEYGTQDSTTFRIEDTSGKIVSSDRNDRSTLGFSGDDAVMELIGSAPIIVYPSDDSATINTSQTTNFNDLGFLVADRTADLLQGSYIKFNNFTGVSTSNLSAVGISSATLYIYSISQTDNTENLSLYQVYTNATWNETSITYANQPCGANPILQDKSKCNLTSVNISSVARNVWTGMDITSALRSAFRRNQSNFSLFAVMNSSGSIYFGNRESSTKAYLVIRLSTQAAAFRIRQAGTTNDNCVFYFNGNFSCSGTSTFSSVSGVIPTTGYPNLRGAYVWVNASTTPLKFKNLTSSRINAVTGTGDIDIDGINPNNYSANSFRIDINGQTQRKGYVQLYQLIAGPATPLCVCDDGTSCLMSPGAECSSTANETISLTFANCVDPASPPNISEGGFINISFDVNNGIPKQKLLFFPKISNDSLCDHTLYYADDGSAYYDQGLSQIAYTKSFIKVNGSEVTSGIPFIKPEHIIDVDDAQIEGDLNTYVDIAGDTMTGNLTLPTLFTQNATTNGCELGAMRSNITGAGAGKICLCVSTGWKCVAVA